MAAITDLSDLVNLLTGGGAAAPEMVWAWRGYSVAGTTDSWVAGGFYSTWRYEGSGGAGVVPTTVEAPTKATVGAMPFTNPGGGRTKWVVGAQTVLGNQTSIGAVLYYDRLLHIGSLSGTVTSAQTVGGTITRNTGGVGNRIFFEQYANVGTTARTITASYTNQSGTSGRTSVATQIGGSASSVANDDNLFQEMPLQAGDTGVQSVQSVTLSASTGAAGNFGIVIAQPLFWSGGADRGVSQQDFTVGPGTMPSLTTDACVTTALTAASTTEAGFWTAMSTVEK